MTIERVNPQFGLQSGITPGLSAGRLSNQAASGGVDSALLFGALAGGGQTLQNASASPEFTQIWQDKFMVWGARESASAAAIQVVGNVPTKLSRTGAALKSTLPGLDPTVSAMLDKIRQPAPNTYMRTYGELFHLGNTKTSPMNWNNYKATVKTNFEGFTNRFSQAVHGKQSFFNEVTPKSFLKETVWEANARAIRDIPTAKTWGERLPGLSRLLGVGFMSFDVLRSTRETYNIAKAQEDGSIISRLKTLGLSAKTFAQKSFKNVVAWEVAGAAAAFGHALALPGLAGVLAPIAVGALAGAGTIMLLNKVLKEPQKPQHQAASNPFQQAAQA